MSKPELEEAKKGIDYLIEIRAVARKYGYFELADKIRDGLANLEIELRDEAKSSGQVGK